MNEIIFIVHRSDEASLKRKRSIILYFTEGETIKEWKQNIREAIHCHFEKDAPKILRLHYFK